MSDQSPQSPSDQSPPSESLFGVPPPAPPSPRSRAAPGGTGGAGATNPMDYQTAADVVGFVPNIRKNDNIFQIICVTITSLAGLIAGPFVITAKDIPLLVVLVIGATVGFIIGGVLSGALLMILGWIRFANKIEDASTARDAARDRAG